MIKKIGILLITAALVVGIGALLRSSSNGSEAASTNNVTVVDGVQYIDITAKGGYAPKKTLAKAGLPTVLRVATNGTYDCSSIITVPSQSISVNLPANGSTEIPLASSDTGVLNGTCTMGMYNFEIDFQG